MPSNALQTQESVDTRGRIAEALAELSRAVHKIGMYPPEHPLVPAAIQTVQESVAAALSSIPSLRLGVAKEKILFDGEPLDEKNSAIRWIAKCLHGAGIAVLDLTPQAGPQELRLLVSWLYRARRADSLASGEELAAAKLPGLLVELVDYDRLAFGEKHEENADKVWENLANALLRELPRGETFIPSEGLRRLSAERTPAEDPSGVPSPLSPEILARRIDSTLEQSGEGEEDQIASKVLAVGRRLQHMQPAVREDVRRRLASLITHLSPQLQRQLLRFAPTERQRQESTHFVSEMADLLPEELVLEVLGDVGQAGQQIPHQMMTLLSKLRGLGGGEKGAALEGQARHDAEPALAGAPGGEAARGILREMFTNRVDTDPNPLAYQRLLEKISSEQASIAAPVSIPPSYRDPRDSEDRRAAAAIIAVRLLADDAAGSELPALLDYVCGAAIELLKGGRFAELEEGVAAARRVLQAEQPGEEAKKAAEALMAQLRRPDVIDLLLDAPENEAAQQASERATLFAATGSEGVLRALSSFSALPSGGRRKQHVRFLAAAEAEPLLEGFGRLAEEGTEALRGALPLLRRLPVREAIVIGRRLTLHEDAEIRMEAYRTLAEVDRRDGAFERYIESALWDAELRVSAFTLELLKRRADEAACAMLSRYVGGEFGLAQHELRLRAIAVLSEFPSAAARDALINVLHSGGLSFRKNELGLRVAAERALLRRKDAVSVKALRRWQRSPAYWASLLVVRRSA